MMAGTVGEEWAEYKAPAVYLPLLLHRRCECQHKKGREQFRTIIQIVLALQGP